MQVRFDIFPRFKTSDMYSELLALHPGQTIRRPVVRQALEKAAMGPLQRMALQVCADAADFADCSDGTKRVALGAAFREAHGAQFGELGVSAAEANRINAECDKAAAEGTALRAEAFRPVARAGLNQLCEAYIGLLGAEGASLPADLGSKSFALAQPDPKPPGVDRDGDDDDYAAGW